MPTTWSINDVIRESFSEVWGERGQNVILLRWDSWREPVANSAALPLTNNDDGDVRETLDDHTLHIWNGSAWIIPTVSWVVTTDQTVWQTIGNTTNRLTKLWVTDITVTNAISGDITWNAWTVTWANEASDTTCFIAFATAVSWSLAPKTNTNMTFNASTWVVTFASSVLTTTDINGGTIDWTTIGATVASSIIATTIVWNSFVPNSATIPSNWMYLPAANTLGWAISSAIEVQLTSTALSPWAAGGSSLGTTTLGWQNLFGNTWFVLNIANSNWVATHTTGILTVGTWDLRVTNAWTNTASVVTVWWSQTLTAKILTSATITTWLTPTANDGAALWSTSLQFSDLFLAEWWVINWDNGDLTLTQTNNELVLAWWNLDIGAWNILRLTAGATMKLTVPTSDLTATWPTCGDFNCWYTSSAIGDLVYLDSSSTWQKCDANTLALYNWFLGIALEVKASANALLVALPWSFIYSTTGFPTWTIGGPIYMSETAGAMTQTQPVTTDAAIRIVWWWVHADKMYFYPESGYITHT